MNRQSFLGKKRVRPKPRKRLRRARKNNTRYMFSRGLQTMGVGTAKVRVTRFYSYLPNTIGTNQNFVSEIIRDSVASQEFNRFAQDFNYTKLSRLTVTCVPTATNSQLPIFFKVDWINGDAQDVTFDDNSKLIWNSTTKPIVYSFKPPNILLNNLNSEADIKINYREWQDSKTIVAENIPGYVKVTTGLTTKLIMEVIWIFRGYNAKFPYTNKEIINKQNGEDKEENKEVDKLEKKIDNMKLKEEDEEDQKEEKAKNPKFEDVPQEVLKAYNIYKEHKRIIKKYEEEHKED